MGQLKISIQNLSVALRKQLKLETGLKPPAHAYMLYFQAKFKETKDQLKIIGKDSSAPSVAKVIGSQWRTLSLRQKEEYQELFEKNRDKYEAAIHALPSEQPEKLKILKLRKEVQQLLLDLPKRKVTEQTFSDFKLEWGLKSPVNAFSLYVQDQFKVNPGQSKILCKDVVMKASAQWKTLPLQTKEEYLALFEKEKAKYKATVNALPSEQQEKLALLRAEKKNQIKISKLRKELIELVYLPPSRTTPLNILQKQRGLFDGKSIKEEYNKLSSLEQQKIKTSETEFKDKSGYEAWLLEIKQDGREERIAEVMKSLRELKSSGPPEEDLSDSEVVKLLKKFKSDFSLSRKELADRFKEDTGMEIHGVTIEQLMRGDKGFTGKKSASVKLWIVGKTSGPPGFPSKKITQKTQGYIFYILHFTFYILHFTFYILHFIFYILHFTFTLYSLLLHFTFKQL